MSIKGNGGVQGAGGNKPESAEELKQKQAAEQDRAAQQGAASDQAELANGLNGQNRTNNNGGVGNNGNGTTGTGNGTGATGAGNGAGSGSGAGNDIGNLLGGAGNGGSVQMGGFGYAGFFGNQSLEVDQAQLNDLSNKFFNYTQACGNMPFGIGTAAMQNSIGNWFQAFMNCFKFSGSTQTVSGGYQGYSATNVNGVYARDGKYYKPDANGNMVECKQDGSALDQTTTTGTGSGTGTTAGTGTGTTSGAGNVPDGYQATNTAGVYSKDGKYYHYVNGALQECNADGTAISHQADDGAVAGKDKAHRSRHTLSSTPTKKKATTQETPAPKQKSADELAKDQGYKKLADGTYRKGGKSYKYANGRFEYAYDTKYKNGQYVKNGTIYNADGSKSDRSIRSTSAQENVYTLEHYQKEDGWKTQSNVGGRTVLVSEDGKTTLYFDKSGKKIQENFHNTGFMKDGRTEVTRYNYNEKTGQLKSKETYNNQTRTTVRTEYVPAKGLKAGTTKTESAPKTVEEMNSKGEISRSKEKEITTVKIEIKGGTAVKTTTIQRQTVK